MIEVGYHVSPRRNRESIAREGLRLSDSPSKFVWFFASMTEALPFASLRPWAGSWETDIWAADLSKVEVLPDPHPGFRGVTTWAIAEPLEVTRVQLVRGIEAPHG